MLDRSEYQRNYYQAHKEERRQNYNAQTQYLKWVEIKKTLFKLKKQIGSVNYDLILGELEKLERDKH